MRIADNCDKCGHEFDKNEFKALMKNGSVLCRSCFDATKED